MNRNNEELLDAMIKNASKQIIDEIADSYPSPEELECKHTFSPEFRTWVDGRIKQERIRERKNKRVIWWKQFRTVSIHVATALCVLFAGFLLAAFTVPPIRIAVMNFLVQHNEVHTDMDIPQKDEDFYGDSRYVIPYIPEGYEVTNTVENDIALFITFSNKAGKSIWFERHVGAVGLTIDREDIHEEIVTIGNRDAYYFYKNGIYTIVITDENFGYKITSDTDEIDELILMAQYILDEK